jgi:hypothetical protein
LAMNAPVSGRDCSMRATLHDQGLFDAGRARFRLAPEAQLLIYAFDRI